MRSRSHICLRETDPDWDKDLAEDVKGECQTKYGKVVHIKVERDSDVSLHHTTLTGKYNIEFS